MGLRKLIFATGEIYHVYNHSQYNVPIFRSKRTCNLFLETMKFYLQPFPPTRFSIYRTNRDKFPINLKNPIVTIINYCLMPNHFHLLLRQENDNGIKNFVQKISNSYAHYFALKNQIKGHIFGGNFKAVRIENEEQLIHTSRYIHLNPVTSYLVEKPEDYLFSSYSISLKERFVDFVHPEEITNYFSSIKKYEEFVTAQKNYQRTLQLIKHLTLE